MKKIMKNIYYKSKEILDNCSKDNVSEYSAQCAYYTILSFIPFLIILLTMIQYTGITQQNLYGIISKILPENMKEMILGIVQEVYSKSLGTISISLIFTLWSAGKGLYAFTKGLQKIYGQKNKIQTNYFYLRIRAIVQTMLFILLIVIGLVVLVFGSSLLSIAKNHFGILKNFNVVNGILMNISLLIISFIVFLLLYRFIARTNKKLKNQIIGAIFSSIALNIVSYVFSIYLDLFKGFSITYGSLTTLILIMMWIYTCFYIIFLGAEINKSTNSKEK